jgi:hypothetical protein
MASKRRNWMQVRHRIDSGGTGDKVNFPDPAAAPLGTDEEAGGFSTSSEAIAEAEAQQTSKHKVSIRGHKPGEERIP